MVEGARPSVLIENPILNSPYDEPTRHFRFDDNGITDEVVEGRRPSSYFVPIPAAKKVYRLHWLESCGAVGSSGTVPACGRPRHTEPGHSHEPRSTSRSQTCPAYRTTSSASDD